MWNLFKKETIVNCKLQDNPAEKSEEEIVGNFYQESDKQILKQQKEDDAKRLELEKAAEKRRKNAALELKRKRREEEEKAREKEKRRNERRDAVRTWAALLFGFQNPGLVQVETVDGEVIEPDDSHSLPTGHVPDHFEPWQTEDAKIVGGKGVTPIDILASQHPASPLDILKSQHPKK